MIAPTAARKEGLMDVKTLIGWKKKQYLVLVDGMLFLFLYQGGPRLNKIALYGRFSLIHSFILLGFVHITNSEFR
jgi:hypothetical protein